MKVLITAATAIGLLVSPAMAEPVKLAPAQLTAVTAGLLDGSNVAFVISTNFGDVGGGTIADPPEGSTNTVSFDVSGGPANNSINPSLITLGSTLLNQQIGSAPVGGGGG